jgi:hypothetical protein
MASPRIVKNISSEYLIKGAANTAAAVVIGSDTRNDATLTVNGNLTVMGTQTTINSVNANIADNIITLNSGLAANIAPTLNAGIEVNRGSSPTATLRWNETLDRWEITDSAGNFQAIIFGNSTSFALINDPAPTLGANLVVNNFSITTDYTHPDVLIAPKRDTVVDSAIFLKRLTGMDQPIEASGDHNYIYGGDPAGGGSGVYVFHNTSTTTARPELITKSKAIVYSLIF